MAYTLVMITRPLNRRIYPQRGLVQKSDFIFEALHSRICIICGATIVRKKAGVRKVEQLSRFIKRKTCGRIKDDRTGNYVGLNCLVKLQTGEGNPNYGNRWKKHE